MYFLLLLTLISINYSVEANYYGSYHCKPGRDVVVHLFEWKWTDIEKECSFLAQQGYCAVQVSPPNEHRKIGSNPWYQRYQPVSYKMNSRSGNEDQFKRMVSTCNDQGVWIYVDAVINHMTGGGWGTGSAGSSWNADSQSFPGVPFGNNDFNGHDVCHTHDLNIHNYNNANEVRNCRLVGLRDLRGGSGYVQEKIAEWMNRIIGWGVAGFRIDASKHMWPQDIQQTLDRLQNLNTHWFPHGTKPYVFLEVIDMGFGEPIQATHYQHIGRVTEFRHGYNLGNTFRKNPGQKLAHLHGFGSSWGQLDGMSALVFMDNHDNQRGHGAGGFGSILTYFEPRAYKMANAFQLAWDYGHVRIMSSYNWNRNIQNGKDSNDWIGPPSDGNGNTYDVSCFNGWVCEHRWRQIFQMVGFHNVALGSPVQNWWDNGGNQIAFGRGNKGFIAFNNEDYAMNRQMHTGLPDGEYCDVITCDNNRPPCGNSGGMCRDVIRVGGSYAQIHISNQDEDPMIAIHV